MQEEHIVEVNSEDFRAIVTQFGGASGWRRSNGKGSFNPVVHTHSGDNRRKLKYGAIVIVEKVDTEE